MLNSVPESVSALSRQVVINHPNAYNCEIYRKNVDRTAPDTMGGAPTLGGLGVLDSEDEEDISYEWIGNGFALQAEPFQPSQMMDRQDANNSYAVELRFMIVPEDGADFELKKHDITYLLLGNSVKLAWEIVGIETTVNIPPYVTKYVMNPRNDLTLVDETAVPGAQLTD